ncbi:MAG TPA: hypothetical protein VK850_01875, partial [Candidatus Binatia bacterium]|nr:hypothetical protein [Candidatus Binatia bacterium]
SHARRRHIFPKGRLAGTLALPSNLSRLKPKSPCPNETPGQGPNGRWEFAKLSFPCRHWAPYLGMAAGFPTLFSTASGVFGLVAGPSSTLRLLNFE